MKVFGLAGWSGSGKTTLLVGLVRVLTRRGLSVSTVKHAHHDFDIDQPGKDSYRHREAGATEVVVASDRRWALMHELAPAAEPRLEELIARMDDVDLVLVEGYKWHPHDKIEVHRAALGRPLLWPDDPRIVAVASDDALSGSAPPLLPLSDPASVADFIVDHCRIKVVRRAVVRG